MAAWLLWPTDWFLAASLVRKGAQARGQGWEMAVFGPKVQVKAHPLGVVRTLVCRHLSLIQPPLQEIGRAHV